MMAAKKKAKKKAAPAAPKLKAATSKQTKTQIIQTIADDTDMSKKDVKAVVDSLGTLCARHMMKRGSGEFSIPSMGVKVRRVRKPATKARKAVNPFTGEPMTVKAKPARNVVKVSALKALKESVG
jgi:nucleoid DNA-binding protein